MVLKSARRQVKGRGTIKTKNVKISTPTIPKAMRFWIYVRVFAGGQVGRGSGGRRGGVGNEAESGTSVSDCLRVPPVVLDHAAAS